jgi:integrase
MADLAVLSADAQSPLARLVDDYLMSCRARGLGRGTLKNSYGYPLSGIFLPWCSERGVRELNQLNGRTMDSFSVALIDRRTKAGKPLEKSSIHAYSRAVRGFLNWCAQEGEGTAAKPPLPKLPRRVLDVLNPDEIDNLEACAGTERDRLMIRVLGDCGLRAEELCALTPDDVIRRDRQAHLLVHGKGERDRLVPLPPALVRRVERYVRSVRPADTRATALFVSLRRGRGGDYEPLTPSGVLQMVARTAEQAGISKPVYTHLFRHSFITNALRAGMSPLLVAQVAGHTSLRMIERTYSHLNSDDAYEAMMKMLVRDRRR